MLKAIIFDYNGVLVDDLKAHEDAYLFAAKAFGRALTRETIRRYVSHAIQEKREFYFAGISDQEWHDLLRIKTKRYFEIAANRNLVFPHVPAVLNSLSGKYTLALMSNTTRENFNGVFPTALARLFQETLFADEVENPKPSPDPLLKIMRRLGVSFEECCYVGDSLLDIQMSRSAGVRVLGVATGQNTLDELRGAGADHAVTGLLKVKDILTASRKTA
jgi:beta-phosphoglucomutase